MLWELQASVPNNFSPIIESATFHANFFMDWGNATHTDKRFLFFSLSLIPLLSRIMRIFDMKDWAPVIALNFGMKYDVFFVLDLF